MSSTPNALPVHENIRKMLDSFTESKKIPHIIFYGASGTGKRTVVYEFLQKIYNYNKANMKTNIMFVNCAHGNGKGIKFIREDLKTFAKTNIQFNRGIMFKTVVLLNADFLTVDAQSALRRCIEEFSLSTRFFIVVENKNKLLNPILSRFCEIYFPEYTDADGNILNLHQHQLRVKYKFDKVKEEREARLSEILDGLTQQNHNRDMVNIVDLLYSEGFSGLDLHKWIQTRDIAQDKQSALSMCFQKIRSEYRCEKLLMLYMLNQYVELCTTDIDSVQFMNGVGFI